MSAAEELADRIADAVLFRFDSLPAKYKPAKDPQRGSNWIPLSGIVLEDELGSLECISLATGMKCLPAVKIPSAKGKVLHDSHAEILALRAFNHFLLQECLALNKNEGYQSRILVNTDDPELPFAVLPGLKFHMYSSEAPCGDASMELIMDKQEDQTPWTSTSTEQLLGRGDFSKLGVVRRKPSRGDSPETLSKSCSDKLALKQCTGFLSSHTSCLISPENAYLTSLVVPESQYINISMERCFNRAGRLASLDPASLLGEYAFRPFSIHTTTREFHFSHRAMPLSGQAPKGSNMAAIWNPFGQEVIINGILQGRRQTDRNCASMVSRSSLISRVKDAKGKDWNSGTTSYVHFKSSHPQLVKRAEVKQKVIDQGLNGWLRNTEDDFEI